MFIVFRGQKPTEKGTFWAHLWYVFACGEAAAAGGLGAGLGHSCSPEHSSCRSSQPKSRQMRYVCDGLRLFIGPVMETPAVPQFPSCRCFLNMVVHVEKSSLGY